MNLGETMVEEEADELLQEAEINADGNVDYMSFVKGLFSNL
jgi:Ca2+-binding EF-hand superfamily protein